MEAVTTATIEPVMESGTDAKYAQFLGDCPMFERMLTDQSSLPHKYWLELTRRSRRNAWTSALPTR